MKIEWDLEGYLVSMDDLLNKMVMAEADCLREAGKDAPEALGTWSNRSETKGIISMLFSFSEESQLKRNVVLSD
ncbi:hypothetical protein F5B21DRAFT_461186 [Xylaria acuta]|nr:hypothetical protein F5B21DRAFT_461186 [Xylaria acuta]